MSNDSGAGTRTKQLRSRAWFDNPNQAWHDGAVPGAVFEFRAHPGRIAVGQANHRHCANRIRDWRRAIAITSYSPSASPPAYAPPAAYPLRVPRPRFPRNRQASRRPHLTATGPGAGGSAVWLSAGWRGAHHRLRQDHARLFDGRGHSQSARHRPIGRTHVERLAQGQAHRIRNHCLEGAPNVGGR